MHLLARDEAIELVVVRLVYAVLETQLLGARFFTRNEALSDFLTCAL